MEETEFSGWDITSSDGLDGDWEDFVDEQ